jgi:hypothetical protein
LTFSWFLDPQEQSSVFREGQSHPNKKDLLNVLRWEQIYAQMLSDPQGQSLIITDESECC